MFAVDVGGLQVGRCVVEFEWGRLVRIARVVERGLVELLGELR